MKFSNSFLLVALIITPLFANSQTPKNMDWETWQNSTGTVSISHPKSWIKWEMDIGEIAGFVARKDSPDDHFPDMLLLRESYSINNKSLDDLETNWMKEIERKPNINLISAEQVKIGNYTAFKTVATNIEGDKVTVVNYTYIIGNKIYLLSLTVEQRNYDRFKAIGEEAAKSLKIE